MFSFNANAAFTVIIGVFVLYVLLSLGTGNFALDKKVTPGLCRGCFGR